MSWELKRFRTDLTLKVTKGVRDWIVENRFNYNPEIHTFRTFDEAVAWIREYYSSGSGTVEE